MIEPISDTIDEGTALLADPLHAALAAGIAVVVALAIHAALFFLLRRIARRTDESADDIVVRHLHRPTRLAFVVLALMAAAREVPELRDIWADIATFVLPAVVGWMALAILRALVEAQRVHGRDEVLDALGDARRVDRVALLQVRRRRAHAQQPVARARAVDAPLREERLGARDRAVARQRGLARAELGDELAARLLVVGRGHGAPRVRLLHGLAGLEQGIKVRQVRLAPPLPRARVEGGVGHQVAVQK